MPPISRLRSPVARRRYPIRRMFTSANRRLSRAPVPTMSHAHSGGGFNATTTDPSVEPPRPIHTRKSLVAWGLRPWRVPRCFLRESIPSGLGAPGGALNDEPLVEVHVKHRVELIADVGRTGLAQFT